MQNKSADWKEKDLEEKMLALSIVEKQYPAMSKLREALKGDKETFRKLYSITLMECVSLELNIPISGINVLGGKPYVNKGGLTHKVQKDPRRVSKIYAIPIIYPMKIIPLNMPTDQDMKKYFIGHSEDGTCTMKGIVEFEDGSRFEDQGTANAKYMNKDWGKMHTMIPYIIELACTRATNRAIRLATGIGLVSVEELNERGFSIVKELSSQDTSGYKITMIKEINDFYKSLDFNEAKCIAFNSKYGGVSVLDEMTEKSVSALLSVLKGLKPLTKVAVNGKQKETTKKLKKIK